MRGECSVISCGIRAPSPLLAKLWTTRSNHPSDGDGYPSQSQTGAWHSPPHWSDVANDASFGHHFMSTDARNGENFHSSSINNQIPNFRLVNLICSIPCERPRVVGLTDMRPGLSSKATCTPRNTPQYLETRRQVTLSIFMEPRSGPEIYMRAHFLITNCIVGAFRAVAGSGCRRRPALLQTSGFGIC